MKAMIPLKYFYNPPFIIKKFFPHFQWNTSNGKILLTFDDGPAKGSAEVILNELNKNKVKAVFFCVGRNVSNNPELTRLMLNEGHTIANHTFNHKRLTKISYDESVNEIISFNRLMEEKFNYAVKFFRPPYGRFKLNTGKLVETCGLKNVMWSLLTYDYKNDLDLVKFAVEKYIERNSIFVLHDRVKNINIVRESIQIILEAANKKGYEIGEPEECLK